MKIIVDAMGGDNAPDEIVRGAVEASGEFGVEVVLTGRVEEILRSLEKMGRKELPKGVEIANAPEAIAMDEDPVMAIREKKDSSMVVGLNLLKDGFAQAMVSAGNTGALLSGATLVVRRISGVRRAALAPVLPVTEKGVVLIDGGANAECTPEYLLQFAYMGAAYAERVLKVENPRVGLLNIGAERIKGTSLQIEAYRLLEEAAAKGHLNFVGNVEPKGVVCGECDVIVCDGYSGNILLKSIEGTASFFMRQVRGVFTKGVRTKLASFFVRRELKSLKARMDADRVGGTPLLGISKPVIKAHGSSNSTALKNAVLQAVKAVESNVCEQISSSVGHMRVQEVADKNPQN